MRRMKNTCALLAAIAVLTGTVSDKTTGQPLTGVTITTQHAGHTFTARTNAAGRFALRNMPDGTYTLHLSSKDVPDQSIQVRVKGSTTHVHLRACSTTLDYSCGQGGGNGPGGG